MNVNLLCPGMDHRPVVITATTDNSLMALLSYTESNAEGLQELLLKHGAVLFRGFDINGASNFQRCVETLGGISFGYIGGNSPRNHVVDNVYTSTEYPASEVISLHNEMSYLPSWPRRIFFYCMVPAELGGETSIANGGDVLRSIPDSIVRKFREKKIKYIRNFLPESSLGKSWQSTYSTTDRSEVEHILSLQGSVGEWRADGSLRVETCCKAVFEHPLSKKEVWFNQAEQWHPSALKPALRELLQQMLGKGNMPHECEYEDGEPLDEVELNIIRSSLNDNKLLFGWHKNDIWMIDNISMMHGREAFKGQRKVMAFLSSV